MRAAVGATAAGRICGPEHPDGPVKLVGEFDAFDLPALRCVLDGAEIFGRPVSVDLSGVRFLDVGCARELLSRLARGGVLELRDPSWQAEASFEALGLLRSPDDAKDGADEGAVVGTLGPATAPRGLLAGQAGGDSH